jgi:hypothetical protein
MKANAAALRACSIGLGVTWLSLLGCVTEKVQYSPPRSSESTIFEFPPPGTPPAGIYHGVNFFFEVDANDLPDAKEWMNEEQDRLLPPIIPEIGAGGIEIYRVRDIHRVEYQNSLFQVDVYRYPRMPNARLYAFKKRAGNFGFAFRGQGIVVPSDVPWTPSIYYYWTIETGPSGRQAKKEVVLVGLARIETEPEDGYWLVNGRKYYPDNKRPLELFGAVHVVVPR